MFAITPTPTPHPPITEGSVVRVQIDAIVGSLRLLGYTSPNSVVTFLFENNVAGTQVSCPGGDPLICASNAPGYFDKTFSGLYPGTYNIGIYSIDSDSLSTPTINRIIPIIQGEASSPDVLTLPPTIEVSKVTIKRPELQTVSGKARPNSNVQVQFASNPTPGTAIIQNDGNWSVTNPEVLHLGSNFVYSFVQGSGGAISQNSKIINFTVQMSADLNIDTEVDISDFSMLMFNYGLTTPPNWAADINDDTYVDLSDFSIMMFNWSGDVGQAPAPSPTPSPSPTVSPSPSPSPTP